MFKGVEEVPDSPNDAVFRTLHLLDAFNVRVEEKGFTQQDFLDDDGEEVDERG